MSDVAGAMALIPSKGDSMQEQQQRVSGTVVNANERGFQLQGEEAWQNWSKYAEEPRTLPAPGERIVAMLDKAGYVRSVLRSDPPATAKAKEAKAAYNGVYAAVAAKPVVAPSTAAPPQQAARNPQLDREFRLKCLVVALEHLDELNVYYSANGDILSIGESLAAWAEGKE